MNEKSDGRIDISLNSGNIFGNVSSFFSELFAEHFQYIFNDAYTIHYMNLKYLVRFLLCFQSFTQKYVVFIS